MYKQGLYVRHKRIKAEGIMQILRVVNEDPNDENNTTYLVRHFANGKFYSEIFYHFELEPTD